jgi:hypothetical protein
MNYKYNLLQNHKYIVGNAVPGIPQFGSNFLLIKSSTYFFNHYQCYLLRLYQ